MNWSWSWQRRDHFKLPDEARHQRHCLFNPPVKGFPGGSDSKESAYNAGDMGLIPGSERSPGGGGQPTPIFLLENPMDRGAWWATVHRLAKSWTWLKWLARTQGNTVNKINKVYLFIFNCSIWVNTPRVWVSLFYFPLSNCQFVYCISFQGKLCYGLSHSLSISIKKYFNDNPCYDFL